MSRCRTRDRSETVRHVAAHVRENLCVLAIISARANLARLAAHQREIAAREVCTGRALTGMPAYRSTEPRLPGALNVPDLSGDIARMPNELLRELLDVG
jgi:hypothetical protein